MKRWLLLLLPLLASAQNPASVWITAPDSRIIAGSTVQLTVLARDSAGRALPNANCSFSATGNNPFTVTTSGTLTANTLGIGDITAICGNARNNIRLQSVPSAINVTPADKEISVGDTISYAAQVLDVNSRPIAGVPLIWNVIGEDGNGTVSVSIAGNGLLNSVGVGRFTVRATFSYNPPPDGQPNAGSGQFIQQFYGRARVTVRPPKTYKLTRLASTGDRRDAFQLRPRRSQIAVNASGQVAFNASLEGYATGFFLHDGEPHLLASAGAPGDVPGSMIWDFDEPAVNIYGEVFASTGYWGIGSGLVWIFPGAQPRYVLQDGSTAFDIRNIFASRLSLNDSGQAVFRGSLVSPDGKSRNTGLFSITRDGVLDLLLDTTQTLQGLPPGWSLTNEFAVDNALDVAFSVSSGGAQTIYLRDTNGVLRRIIGAGDRLDNRDIRNVRSPVLSPDSGDLGFMVDFTTGPARLVLCPQADCSRSLSFDSGDLRNIYMIGAGSQVVFYGNASILVWDGKTAPRTILQENKLAPTGAVYTQFQSAGITASGDVIAQARTSTNLFLIVRASGNQRTVLVKAGDFVKGTAGPAFANLAIGGKTGPTHLLTGGNRNNVFEASPDAVLPKFLAGDRLPTGSWFEANYSVRKTPAGDLFVASDDALHLVNAGSLTVLQTFPFVLDGVSTNSAFTYAANASGLIATVHGTNVNTNRMLLLQNGAWRHLAWIGSNNPAYRTASPAGGNFDGVNDHWITDDGLVYANMRVNGGPSGLFVHDGSQWRAIALVNDDIDGRKLQSVQDIRVGGSHIFARLQLTNRIAIYEYAGGSWKSIVGQSDDAPTGNTISYVGTFDADRQGNIAARIDSGGASQLIVYSSGNAKVVQDFNQAVAETGEWLREPNMIDLRDDGRIFFTIRNYLDQFNLYEADPVL